MLVAASVAWRLDAGAFAVAVIVSLASQLAIVAVAQVFQVAVVRWVRPRRRAWVWGAARLFGGGAMASVWISATAILRSPERLAPRLAGLDAWLALSPAALLSAPLAAYRRAGAGAGLWATVPIVLAAAAAFGVAVVVAARAGLRGWEEAGAPQASSAPVLGVSSPSSPLSQKMQLVIASVESGLTL